MKTKIIKNPQDLAFIEQMRQHMQVSNLSAKTIKSYLWSVERTLKFTGKTIETLESDDILSWLVYQHDNQAKGFSTMNITVCSLRYMYKHVVGDERVISKVPYPRKNKLLPEVLSGRELKRLFACCEKLKYRLILELIYGGGLRISEAINLQITDIDSKNLLIRVGCGKGKQSRYTLLSAKLIPLLRDYYKRYQPEKYLFNGYKKGVKISKTSIQRHFRLAKDAAGIAKEVSVHSLRHCFAVHLLLLQTDIVTIQHYLGHSDIHTTMMYLKMIPHTGKTPQSPLDYLL